MSNIALGLHGGCGTLDRSLMSEADWAESRAHMADALRAGWRVLTGGGTALDAVQATVMVLEDSAHFNAGYGAAFEMDDAKRRKYLEDANALVEKDRPRLPIVSVGSAWAMVKDKVVIKARVDEDTLAMNIKPAK